MRGHLPALDHGRMDPAPARYVIRIKGHLGATILSAFPALAPQARSAVAPCSAPGHWARSGPRPGTWQSNNGISRRQPGTGPVTGDSGRAGWLAQARSYLRGADPVLARLIDERPDSIRGRRWPSCRRRTAAVRCCPGRRGSSFSVAATRRTLARIEDLFGGHPPAPIELLSQAVAPHMQQQGSGTIVHVTARPGAFHRHAY
jgi:hypothetical protein